MTMPISRACRRALRIHICLEVGGDWTSYQARMDNRCPYMLHHATSFSAARVSFAVKTFNMPNF